MDLLKRHRRSLALVLFILLASTLVVGPTQAVSGLVGLGRSMQELLGLEAPAGLPTPAAIAKKDDTPGGAYYSPGYGVIAESPAGIDWVSQYVGGDFEPGRPCDRLADSIVDERPLPPGFSGGSQVTPHSVTKARWTARQSAKCRPAPRR